MVDDFQALRSVPLFSAMSDKDLRRLLDIAKEVRHDDGQAVVEEDHTAIGFHLILDGSAEAAVGGETKTAMGPGDYFGEMSLIDGKPRSATVTAKGELRTLVIPSWTFNHILDEHPEMMRALMVELCARLRAIEGPRG